MARSRSKFPVALWVIFVCATLLAAMVLRANPVLAPTPAAVQQVPATEAATRPYAPSPATGNASPAPVNSASQQPISAASQPAAPAGASLPVASSPAMCPSQPGSGLPCQSLP